MPPKKIYTNALSSKSSKTKMSKVIPITDTDLTAVTSRLPDNTIKFLQYLLECDLSSVECQYSESTHKIKEFLLEQSVSVESVLLSVPSKTLEVRCKFKDAASAQVLVNSYIISKYFNFKRSQVGPCVSKIAIMTCKYILHCLEHSLSHDVLSASKLPDDVSKYQDTFDNMIKSYTSKSGILHSCTLCNIDKPNIFSYIRKCDDPSIVEMKNEFHLLLRSNFRARIKSIFSQLLCIGIESSYCGVQASGMRNLYSCCCYNGEEIIDRSDILHECDDIHERILKAFGPILGTGDDREGCSDKTKDILCVLMEKLLVTLSSIPRKSYIPSFKNVMVECKVLEPSGIWDMSCVNEAMDIDSTHNKQCECHIEITDTSTDK